MMGKTLALQLLPENLAVCRLEPDQPVPDWAMQGAFYSVTRTADEISVVCPEQVVPEDTKAERGWRAFKVEGPLEFSMTGVLAALVGTLGEAGISLFAMSTYDTDYLLIRAEDATSATAALRGAGHSVAVANS